MVSTQTLALGLCSPSVAITPILSAYRQGLQADPAKAQPAVHTEDVVTSAVLLDGRGAFGTWLGMQNDPIACLGVILALVEPELGETAKDWHVIIQITAKAGRMSRQAGHRGHQGERRGEVVL